MTFAKIQCLEDILPAVQGRTDFSVVERADQGIITVNYIAQIPDTFPHISDPMALLRYEARGIKFDTKTHKIIARPFHKFFNVGERPDTQLAELPKGKFMLLEKLDGSMIHPILRDGKPVYMTKAGETDTVKNVNTFVIENPKYNALSTALLHRGITPLFEWVSPKNRIVLPYGEQNLVLTAARHMVSGQYLSQDELQQHTNNFGVPLVKPAAITVNMSELLEKVRGMKDIEGFVMCFEDGQRFKLKTEWYFNQHQAKSELQHEKDVWKAVLANKADDYYARLDTGDATRLRAFSDALTTELVKRSQSIQAEVAQFLQTVQLTEPDPKLKQIAIKRKFSKERAANLDQRLLAYYYAALDGANILENMQKTVLKETLSGPRLDKIRWLVGGLKVEPFMFDGDREEALNTTSPANTKGLEV